MELKFYKCAICGQIVAKIKDTGAALVCCGQEMMELLPKEAKDEGKEKHVPVVTVNGNQATVEVGSVPHPSLEAHRIEFIALLTDKGEQRKEIPLLGEPKAVFPLLPGEKVITAYAYCNLHGLWKLDC